MDREVIFTILQLNVKLINMNDRDQKILDAAIDVLSRYWRAARQRWAII